MIKVYGIGTCDSCRKMRKWLDAQGKSHEWIDLRATPPAGDKIRTWVAHFGSKALKNTSGASYRALPPEKKEWDDNRWAAEFEKDPMLVKRPVVEVRSKPAVVGFKVDRLSPML